MRGRRGGDAVTRRPDGGAGGDGCVWGVSVEGVGIDENSASAGYFLSRIRNDSSESTSNNEYYAAAIHTTTENFDLNIS